MNRVCISKRKNKGGRNHNCSHTETLYAKFQPRAMFYCRIINSWKWGFIQGLLTDPKQQLAGAILMKQGFENDILGQTERLVRQQKTRGEPCYTVLLPNISIFFN